MKGLYRTKEGSKVEVLDFDEANKMVRTESGWVGFPEYSTWEKEEVVKQEEDFGEPVLDYQEQEIEQPDEEVVEETELAGEIAHDLQEEIQAEETKEEPVKRKRIYKKKAK